MKLGKRLLALLLVMAMLLSNLPVGVLAAETDDSADSMAIVASEEDTDGSVRSAEDSAPAAEAAAQSDVSEDVTSESGDGASGDSGETDDSAASGDSGETDDSAASEGTNEADDSVSEGADEADGNAVSEGADEADGNAVSEGADEADGNAVSEGADEADDSVSEGADETDDSVSEGSNEAGDSLSGDSADTTDDGASDPSEDTAAPADETQDSAADPADDPDHPRYLSFDGLSYQGDGYGPDGTTDLRNGSVRIGEQIFAVFYLNEWNGESYTRTPVHPYSNGDSLALVSMVEEGWEIASGYEDIQDYFYAVGGDACSWDSEILYDLDDGTVLSVPISVELGECSFHWSPDCSPESHMFMWDVRTDGENKVYFRYESDYWTLDSVTWEESQATGQKVDDHIYEFTLTEDFVNSVVNSDGFGHFSVSYSLHNEEGDTSRSSYMLACRYVDRTPYLRYAWLNNDNGQLTEEEFNENDGFGIRPGDTLYQIYYLHYYDEASGNRRVKPVKVEWDGNFLNYRNVSDMAVGGQGNRDYFYEITAHAFGETAEVWCWWNNQKVTMNVDVSMQGLTFHSDSSCTVENHITELLTNANQENVFYCRYTSNDWTMTDLRVPEHQGEATPAGPSIWKVTVNSDFLRNLNNNWEPVWIEYTIRNSETGEIQDHGDSFACQDRTPRLTLNWLWNDGNGGWYVSDVESDNLGLEGPAVYGEHAQRFVIFLLNQWNENGDLITYPVKVQTDCDGIWMTQDVPATEGQEFADYFYQVIGTRWNTEGKIYCQLEDGTRASMDVNTFMGERSFHMDENGGPESFLMEYRVEPFAKENVFYFRFDSGYWQMKEQPELPEEQKGAARIDQVSDTIWKITLDQDFVNDCLGWGQDIYLEYDVIHEDEYGTQEEHWTDSIHCTFHDDGRHPWVGINGDEYYVYEEGYLRSHNTGEQNEEGYDIWAREPVTSLPEGVTYVPEENRLILENANLKQLSLQRGWREWDDGAQKEVWVDNLPEELTIELRGDNSVISDSENALNLMEGLDTTFVGDGYLKVKSTSPRYNSAMSADGVVTFADNVRVDVEIEGEGTYEDGRPATMTAMSLYNADLEIRDNAQVRTILPEGAKMNGPLTNNPDQWGDYAPGGYRSIEVQNVRILGGSLHIQKLDIAEEWDDAGNFIRGGNYVQHGGTVTIDALGGNSWLEDQVELGPHHHYEGLGGYGLDITITGGQLNINITGNPNEQDESNWFFGIITRGGKVELNGGEINFHTNGIEGELFRIENLHRNDAEPIFGQFRITGGSISNNNNGSYTGVFMDLNPGATAKFDGGEIIAHNAEFKLGGEVILNDTTFRLQNSALFLDGQAQIDGGRLEAEDALVSMNGMVTMNDGSFQLKDSLVAVDMAFVFNGGSIDICNVPAEDGKEEPYPAFYVSGYWEVNENARLSIENHMNAPAIEIGWAEDEDGNVVGMGQLLQNGGSIYVWGTSENDPQVMFPQKFHDDGGIWGEPTQGMAMFGGDFTIEGPEGGSINGLRADPGRWVMINGGEMTLWNANMNVSHALVMSPDVENQQIAKLNIFGGRLELSDEAELELNQNAYINIDTTVHNRVEDEWYIALRADWNTSVNIRGGRMNILAENYDCAVDLCGSYVQEGGMVNITARGENSNNLGMAAKSVFDLSGGGLTITANECLQLGRVMEDMPEYPRELNISDGMLKLYAQICGIYQEGHVTISGGDVDIFLEGVPGTNSMKETIWEGYGIQPATWENVEDGIHAESSLTVTGGDITVTMTGDPGSVANYVDGICGYFADVKLLGGTYRAYNCMPLYIIADNTEQLDVLNPDMVVYSLESGRKLDMLTYTDDGLYFALLEEDNVPGDIGTDAGMDYNYGALFVIPKAGQNLTWDVENGLLTFAGQGGMYDFGQMAYGESVNAPWADLSDFITTVEMKDNSPSRIGSNAFWGLEKLTRLNFKGMMPEFAEDAFAGVEADAFYPVDAQWDATKMKDYGGKITWVPDVKTLEVIRIEAAKTWLIPGEKLTLNTVLNHDGTTPITWTLAEGSSRFASLSVKKNVATITAKTATEPQTILVSAVAANGQALPVWQELTVYPAATSVSIFQENGPDTTDVTGQTVKFDYLQENKTLLLSASLNPGYLGRELEQPVVWTSSNAKIAAVAENGVVTITGKGTVKITATAADGSKKKATVTISSLEMIQGLVMNTANPTQILGGKSATFKAIDTDTNKAPKASNVVWSIQEDTAYASISAAGKLTTKAVFEPLTIHVQVASVDNPDAAAVQQVTVYPAVNRVDIIDETNTAVTGGSLYVDLSDVSLDKENDAYLKLINLEAALTPDEVIEGITWKSSNTKIAKVDANGTVTAVLSKGKAVTGSVTITATAKDGSGKSASVKLTLGKPAAEVAVTGAESLVAGKSVTLKAAVTAADGGKPTANSVVWSLANSADSAYVTLTSKGKVTAKTVYEEKEVTIVATSKDGFALAEHTMIIKPKSTNILVILDGGNNNVTKSALILDANQEESTVQLFAGLLNGNDTGKITWSSSNKKYATVDADGLVKAVKSGSVTITAKDSATKKTATVTVKVVKLATGVTVSEKSGKTEDLILAAGKSMTLTAAVADATSKSVTWSVDSGLATISSSGVLKASANVTEPTTVTVTATAKDGSGESNSVNVTLVPLAAGVQIIWTDDGRDVTNDTLVWDMVQDETMSLRSQVYPAGANTAVTWKSSSTKIAKVDKEDGLVTFVKPGTVTITATAADGSGKSASFKLTVTKKMNGLTLPETQVVAGGTSRTLKPDIGPSDTTNKKLTWSISGDTAYASISSAGKLTTKAVTAPKTVTVTATAQDGSGKTASCVVHIHPATTKVTLWNVDEEVTGKTLTLLTGENNSLRLTARSNPDDAGNVCTWTSSDARYVTVAADGTITAVKAGKTITITCTAADGSGKKATVKVQPIQKMMGLELPEQLELVGGKSLTLKPVIEPADTTNDKLTWTLEGENLTGVSLSASGKLTTKKVTEARSVTVTAASQDGTNLVAECEVIIRPRATSVQIRSGEENVTGKTLRLVSNQELSLSADVLAVDAMQDVTWKSSSTKIATVEDGVVTPKKTGTVTITATAKDGSAKKATMKVTVVQAVSAVAVTGKTDIIGGQSLTYKVTASPSNAYNKNITWAIVYSDLAGVAISPEGVLTSPEVETAHTVTLVATSVENPNIVSNPFDVTIRPAVSEIQIQVGETAVTSQSLKKGKTVSLKALIGPEDSLQKVTWKSSSTKIATVSAAGVVKGVKAGKATITCTAADGSGVTKTVSITVK